MERTGKSPVRLSVVLFGLLAWLSAGAAQAALVEQIWVGTWDGTGVGNPAGVGGPGMSVGQRYVIKAIYDDASTTTDNVAVLNSFFVDSGQDMRTINLDDPGNSLDIYVPMEGLDAGSPFIYSQNETNHFPAFIDNPTLNFIEGSSIADKANIIGLEYEGDFFAGAGNNLIELFNTTPDGVSPINMVSSLLNLGIGPAVTDTNGLVDALDVTVGNTAVTYSAADLTKTTSMTVQSNDLGANRSDGETFLSSTWDVSGTTQANGFDQAVGIANSGLANTIDTATWNVTVEEAMTELSGSGQVTVDYANASPSAAVSATANGTGYDFTFAAGDMDLAVTALIANFEILVNSVLVNGLASLFFDTLLATNLQGASQAQLFAAFGAGTHLLTVNVTDLAGAMAVASESFVVNDPGPNPAPLPSTLLLLLAGLVCLNWRRGDAR